MKISRLVRHQQIMQHPLRRRELVSRIVSSHTCCDGVQISYCLRCPMSEFDEPRTGSRGDNTL